MHDHWRDTVEVHPAADLFPMMSDAQLDALAKDIAAHGMHQGIVLWTPERTITADIEADGRCRPSRKAELGRSQSIDRVTG